MWGGQQQEVSQQGRVLKAGMFSDTFESKLADLQNCVMQNADILINRKSQPKQLSAQKSLKSLLRYGYV